MFSPRLHFIVVVTSIALLMLLVGCKGGGGSPVAPPTADMTPPSGQMTTPDNRPSAGEIISTDGPRMLWGLYTIVVEPSGEVYAEPLRSGEKHFNLTMFLLRPHCDYCLTLQKTGLDPDDAWISFVVGLANPTKLAGYDVRGIIITDDEYYLMNPDAMTPYVGPVIYDTPNGFKAYATTEPDNAFPAGGDPIDPEYFYQEFQIHIPPPYQVQKLLQISYAVDVSWPGNCEDPWQIGDTVLEDHLYEGSPAMPLLIDVRDHQNDVTGVTLEGPAGWVGPTLSLANVGGDTWEGEIVNCVGNPPGTYPFLATATSFDGVTETFLYRNVDVVIEDFVCDPDPKNDPSYAETLELVGEYRDKVCPTNPQDYYGINFNDPGMAYLGVLTGTVTLHSCTPGMRIGLVYYDTDLAEYYDGYYVTASDSGSVELKVHITNSVLSGDAVEYCLLAVRSPASGAVDAPYHLVADLSYGSFGSGDPVSVSTVGAPDIPLSGGMVQGALCDPGQIDWFRLDTVGPDAPPGHVIGTLTIDIEEPDPVPPDAYTRLSIRDEDGTLLSNFEVTIPPEATPISLGDMNLPSLYTYYVSLSSPTGSGIDRSYLMVWDAEIDETCSADLIGLENPAPPPISHAPIAWDDPAVPGSSARMWLCDPDDMLDAYPFDLPDGFSAGGEVLGGLIRVQSDPMSYPVIQVSLGLQSMVGPGFCWLSPVSVAGPDVILRTLDYWQVPSDIEGYPLRYWFKVENTIDSWATAQLELDLQPATDCGDDGDSAESPSGVLEPGGTGIGFISPGADIADYWHVDWYGEGRLLGGIGLAADEEVRLRLYSHNVLLEDSQGSTPSVTVMPYDFGPACIGPILKINPIGGDPGQCVRYLITGAGLSETGSCSSDPDENDTLAEIQDKDWLWLSALDTMDEICGVVCREDVNEDVDCLGISGQPFDVQGVLYGSALIVPSSADGHQLKLVSMNGLMEIASSSLDPPHYLAMIELGEYNLPAIPPQGYTYHLAIEPDPTGADSITQYTCMASLGINSEPECPDDGHDVEAESWVLEIPNARLGLLCGFGTIEDVDFGLRDLCDWFQLSYVQAVDEYLTGDITLECDVEDVTVRLMLQGQLAGTGIGLYSASIPSSGDSVTITIPPDTVPSIPALGDNYFIVVHNNGVGGWAPYALEVDLVSQ